MPANPTDRAQSGRARDDVLRDGNEPLIAPRAADEPRDRGSLVQETLAMTDDFDRITRDPRVMNGQPCIRGMRLTVRRVLDAIATYPDRTELFAEYPELEPEDLQQALAFAAASLEDRFVGRQTG
jgi:uncharacterized protein (DUF433 family)